MTDYRLPDGSVPILICSENPDLVGREAAAIADYADAHPAVSPARIAEMLFRTRPARRYRALVMATDRDTMASGLRALAAGEPHPDVVRSDGPASPARVAFVFPGQGSQRPGMGRMLYDHSEPYRSAVDECDKIFHELYQWSPLPYLLDADTPTDEPAHTVQPALFTNMVGVAAMWQAAGVWPYSVVGHSQGEIPACYFAGAQTLPDAVRIVDTRGRIVDGLGLEGFAMAVLGIDRDECEDLLARQAGFAELSVVNADHVLAIAGASDAVGVIVEKLTAEGKFAKQIKVPYPAHTSYMHQLREVLNRTVGPDMDNHSFLPSDIDFIGGTFGDVVRPDQSVMDYWYLNLRNRVRFDRAIAVAARRGANTFIEMSEHPTLMLAMQETLGTLPADVHYRALGTSRRTAEDLREFTRALATVVVHDSEYDWDMLRDNTSGGPRMPLLDFPNTVLNTTKMWAVFNYPAVPPDNADTFLPTRYVEQWTRLKRRSMVPPRTLAVLDPAGAAGELVAAIAAAATKHGATVVDSTSADTLLMLAPPASGARVEDLATFLGEPDWPADLSGVGEMWLVTTGGEHVHAEEVPDPFHAAAQAGFRCLAADHVGTAIRHLDLPAGADPMVAARALIGAIHIADEPELAVRDGGVYARRLVADDAEDRPLDAETLREVVIIGGTGKLGLDFCDRFATAGAQRITLVSRSGGDTGVAGRIRDIEYGSKSEIVRRGCDITDPDAVRALGAEFAESPATLIVHAAVDYAAAESEPTADTVRAAATAKSVALEYVIAHLPLAEHGRIVLCSSLSAGLGGKGLAVYSAVNRLLDAEAIRYRAEGIRCTSVQWGLWRAVGAATADAVATISGAGLLPMDPHSAVVAGFTPDTNAIVAAADWGRLRELFSALEYGPLFAELPEDLPAAVGGGAIAAPAPEPEPVAAASVAEPAVPDEDSVSEGDSVSADTVEITEVVRRALRTVMGLGGTESIDQSMPLVAMGLDSLQALDLRKRVEAELRRDLPVTAILGGASLDEVVSLLA